MPMQPLNDRVRVNVPFAQVCYIKHVIAPTCQLLTLLLGDVWHKKSLVAHQPEDLEFWFLRIFKLQQGLPAIPVLPCEHVLVVAVVRVCFSGVMFKQEIRANPDTCCWFEAHLMSGTVGPGMFKQSP